MLRALIDENVKITECVINARFNVKPDAENLFINLIFYPKGNEKYAS